MLDGLLQIVLTVSESNIRAERLYRSCGFVVFGREPRAVLVEGRAVTKVHMIKTLDGFPVEIGESPAEERLWSVQY